MRKFRRTIRRAFETPKQRKARKNREYCMAVWRTVGTWLGVAAAVSGLVINTLVFMRVYGLHG